MDIRKFCIMLIMMLVLAGAIAGCASPEGSEESGQGAQVEEDAAGAVGSDTSGGEEIDAAYLAGLLSNGAAADGISYDMKITGGGQTMEMSCFLEGSRVKMSGAVDGTESVTIIDGNTMVNYDPVSKTGMKFVNDQDSSSAEGYVDSDLSDNFDDTSLTFIEKGEYGGEECLIVTAKSTVEDVGEMKLWINERLGMVVKMEATASDGQIVTTELSNIKLGKQPAGTFDVPADVEIVELPGMQQ